MRHQNSVLHHVIKLIPWNEFDRLVDQHGSDELVRSFTTRHQLIALLYGQLAGAGSLRAIEVTMESHQGRLYHVGGRAPRRSTFADANRYRSPLVFSGLFQHMLGMATRAVRRKMDDVILLIDSTSLHLAGIGSRWARFSADVCGAKAHVVYDPELGCPVYHAISPANVNDITPAKQMPIQPGASYVFDLGYYDYGWWAKLDAAGCRIVTRFKTSTRLHQARDMRLRILSNDLDAPAQEIADLYKRRWQIELFFRLMKQTLRITHFIGRSENAVRIQIAVALIAFLLLHLLHKTMKVQPRFLDLVRLVRANLMHRKDITRLRHIQTPPPIDSRQLTLNLAST